MPSLTAPFYGNIKSFTVDPQDNSLWVITEKPLGGSIAPTQIFVQDLIQTKRPNDCVKTHKLEKEGTPSITSAYGHDSGLYLTSKEGIVYKKGKLLSEDEEGICEFDTCIELGVEFGLQGITGFVDGRSSFPKSQPVTGDTNQACQRSGKSSNKLLLIGSSQAIVVEIATDGTFSKVKTFDHSNSNGSQISSWAAEVVFSDTEPTTYHCAFGYENGALDMYFTSDDSNNFSEAKLYDADEVEFEAGRELHQRGINALLYVRDIDRYKKENRYLVTTGGDGKTYQISLKESILVPRKPDRYHTRPIQSLVPGGFADGSRREFSRFYSLGGDQTAKVWTNEYNTVALSTYKAEMDVQVGCVMILPVQHNSGPYSTGEFQGKLMPTPHLVIGGKERIKIIPIVKYDRGDTKILKDLDKNGRLEATPILQIDGGMAYVREYGIYSDSTLRKASMKRFYNWDSLELIDTLQEIALNTNFEFAYQKSALVALKNATHERRIICLEDLLNEYNTEPIQELAYESLKEIFENSPRPYQLALENGSHNIILQVIKDLAGLARGNSPLKREALEMLQGLINDSNYDIALRAYDFICGEAKGANDTKEEPVIPGVEGVLYGIYSDRTDIRREMAVRLAKRGLVHAFETTLILRRLLESRNETIRERALDVSLLRAPAVAGILRKNPDNADLHQRLYVLSEGALGSDVDERNKKLLAALPSDEQIEIYEQAFKNEDSSIEDDLDILVELSSCSQDDVSIYALLVKAMLGFEGAAQGLLQLSNHNNEKILRLATIGLGCFIHLDDAFQRICGLTLSKNTPPRIGCISIFYAVKGYDHRKEDPIQNILRKVLDSGNSELRKTALTIGQDRINKRLKRIKKLKEENTGKEQKKQESDINDLRTLLKKAQAGLDYAIKNDNEVVKDSMLDEIADIESQLDQFTGVTRTLSGELAELFAERDLLKIGLQEETIDIRIRKEAYKSFLTHNLEDAALSTNKTPTLKMLLNLRDRVLFDNALKDLLSYLDNVDTREWALKLFKSLINQDIKPKHHSNVWAIWTAGADWSEGKDYEEQVLRIGFECNIPCRCRTLSNGRYEVCTRHRIRRDAFLRVLRASGDWLAAFIREALSGKGNSSAGVNAAAIAVSDQGKAAVDNLDDPESFIFSLFKEKDSKKNIGYACDLLTMFPKHYSERIQKILFAMRKNADVLRAVNQEYRLLTEDFYNFYMDKVKEGRDEKFTKNVERYASEHGLLESIVPVLLDSDNSRLISKALQIASQNYDDWGKDILMKALETDDESKSKRAFGLIKSRLERDALRKKNDDALRDFVVGYFTNAQVHKQTWVLESLRITKNTPSWVKDLIKTSSTHKADEIRQKAFQLIHSTQSKDPWIVEILKAGLTDPNSGISSAAFQGLLAVNKLLGPAEERKFLTESMRKTEENRERAIAAGLKTTASWRVEFILEAINDEDHMIRSYMCEKLRSISGLSDDFYKGLLEHKDLEVRQLAQDVLAARGLYRPRSKYSSDNLESTILEAPPPMPTGWGSWFAWISWYWRVQAWKDRKIKAITAAGKTHDPHYYSVFRKLLTKLGFHSKITDLWRNALRYTSWWYQDWWEFITLEIGWVLSDKDIEEAKKEAKEQREPRIRVAWNIACNRYGDKETLKWTINQYYDNGWRNQYKNFIKREYLFEGLFSVDSFVGFESQTEGPAFSMMQRLMDDDTSFANDLFRLNMLRLSEQGGPVDYIGIGYTCDDDQTVLESVLMRENQHDKDALLKGLLELLNKREIPEKDPYALSNTGGVWYDVVRLTLELNMNTYDLISTIEPEYWQRIARMISCQHPQLRARAVRCYFRRHVYGGEKERFKADIENFSRQLSSTVVDNYELLQDGKGTEQKTSIDLAFDGYIGLLRKREFTLKYRRDAIRYVVGMCSGVEDAQRVVPILKSALTLEKPQLRFEGYRQLIEIQAKENALVKLDQLIQMGLRSTDKRLKKMAISLIWCTDQLDKSEKISRLEFILKNMNDVSAEYAFQLLYAVAGRPASWDKADETKDQDEANAKSTFDKAIEGYNADIKKLREDFNSFQEGFNAAPNSAGQDRSTLESRRSEMVKSIEELETKKREANSQYEQDLSLAVETHKKSMDAPLTEADKQTWADAIARRDALIGMAIDGYYPDLRTSAVDKGITECARRRVYFEKKIEEFEGYFERLLSIVEQALQSPYSSLIQHTAVSMAENYFKGAYKVLLGYLNSHDPELQYIGIEGLTYYGPLGLTEFKDENGNEYPRTSIIFLDRLANDTFGTIDRYSIFNAIGKLRDSHSTVVEALFAFLKRGVEDPDYGTVLSTLITISGCDDWILEDVRWADLTHSDYVCLDHRLSHEIDWEDEKSDNEDEKQEAKQKNLEKFITYYQDVFNESLLARIIDDLYARGDYQNISGYGLIDYCKYTKGFDIWKHTEDGIATEQPIDKILKEIALLDKNSDAGDIRSEAVDVLIYRLETRETWYISALEATKGNSVLIDALTQVIDATKDEVTYELLRLTKVMAYAGLQGRTKAIFTTLYSVATQQSYQVSWRTQAMRALGQMSDERAVEALLKAAGFDSYGEPLLVDPNLPTLSSYDKERLMVAAAEGLGGMIFAQEREGIYQLLSTMTRSQTAKVRRNGFEGLRYFGRSEEHALLVTGIFAARLQSAVNSYNYDNIRRFLTLLCSVLEPLSTEKMIENSEITIRPQTEGLVKEYILQTLFGEVFELDGEAYNPLNIESNLFEIEDTEFLELAFQNVRQLVHGPYQKENQSEGTSQEDGSLEEIKEVPIDYSYLTSKSPEERTTALKAEVLLFKNEADTKYSVDVAKEIANYLSDREIFDLLDQAYQNDFESNTESTIARYNVLFQNIIYRTPSPIGLAFTLMRKDYTLNLHEDLPDCSYQVTVLELLKCNLDGLSQHMTLFEENVLWYQEQFNEFVERSRFGDRQKSHICLSFFNVLQEFFALYESLPNSNVVAEVIKDVMTKVYLVSGLDNPQKAYVGLFESYLKSGSIDWDFVNDILDEQHRSIRNVLVNQLTIELVQDMTPAIFKWLVSDQAALLRLVDVLSAQKSEIQNQIVTSLKDSGQPSSVLLILAKLNNVDVFKTLIDSFRDESGNISDEVGLRSRTAPRSKETATETIYTPITVDVLCQGLSMVATEEAEYYLRDLSEDSSLEYGLRRVASRSADVAHRRRVPLHIRRTQRQQS